MTTPPPSTPTPPSVTLPPRPPWKKIGLAWIGAALAIGVIATLTAICHWALILGSFGASCVLVFGFPEAPFSQPRNVICGHFLSSAIGLTFLHSFGPGPLPLALATATAVAAMMTLRCVHPPAGSNPVIVFLNQPGWAFLLRPTLLGALLLVAVALLYNNLGRARKYPAYW